MLACKEQPLTPTSSRNTTTYSSVVPVADEVALLTCDVCGNGYGREVTTGEDAGIIKCDFCTVRDPHYTRRSLSSISFET